MYRLTVYLSDENKKIIQKMAEDEDRSLTYIAEKLIEKGIKESTRRRTGKKDTEPEN